MINVEKIGEIIKKWEKGEVIQYEYKMANYRRALINIRHIANINLVRCSIEDCSKLRNLVEQADLLLRYGMLPVYERRGYIHLNKLINDLQNMYKKHDFDMGKSLIEPLLLVNDELEFVYDFLRNCDKGDYNTLMKYDRPPHYYLSRLTAVLTHEFFGIIFALSELKLSKSRRAMWDNIITELNANAQILNYYFRFRKFTYWYKLKEFLQKEPTE